MDSLSWLLLIFPGLQVASKKSYVRFISSENHNLRYLGVTGLAQIVQVNPAYAAEHQMVVVDCLEEPPLDWVAFLVF